MVGPRNPRRHYSRGNPAKGELQERRLRAMAHYPLWEQLQKELRSKVGELTIDNAVIGIEQGVGESLVLKLQEIGKQSTEYRKLEMIMPDQVLDAIMGYKNPSYTAPLSPLMRDIALIREEHQRKMRKR